ncbi:NAD(P)-dependent malic enzyme [Euzebya tangerina]|uniref:NAD(P)-dependent malic enzyme n=1 Tax=Euzebya tangerina TaxID=591198 RepID=UPI00196B0B5A|nr:NADP-dependent malic enzyme [Euzebya tangerina]
MSDPEQADASASVASPVSISHTHVVQLGGAARVEAVNAIIRAAGGLPVDAPVVRTPTSPEAVLRAGFRASSKAHAASVVAALRAVDGMVVLDHTDVVLDRHAGGKLAVTATSQVADLEDLAFVYTPGVARPCLDIADDPAAAYDLTIKGNAVAVVSDGSAVLGLGDIGPLAALPVMEGKAILLRDLAGVDAYPICLDERDPDRLVDMIAALATGFGGINLEDISAPRCFEVEGKLRRRLDIPVFHDDQHGTAVVVLAALRNALRVVGKSIGPELRVVVQGIGAAGIAVANLLMAAGVTDVVGVDRAGIVTARRKDARDPIFRRLGKQTNPRDLQGDKTVALAGADVFIGLSGPNTITLDDLRLMADDPIVFAMANPTPEIDPRIAGEIAAVVATGRSDFPNQINNVLCFPGLFRGLLDVRASAVDDRVTLAAAEAIADIVTDAERSPTHIIPSPLDRRVVPAVAAAVAETAAGAGLARSA